VRVVIDRDRCLGNARCAAVAPDVFDVDDDGYSFLIAEPSDDRAPQIELAVVSCPTGAISIEP
jgi:ferredoxin